MIYRTTKKGLVLLLGIFCTVFFCEFLIYHVVIIQCRWPHLQDVHDQQTLKALIIADPHLLGPRKGHWLDKWRREWQMHQAFQTILTLHKPESVFVLGDLFDEGEWSSDKQFNDYVERFFRLFSVPNDTTMHVVVGNHDIGFHNYRRRGSLERFSKLLNAPSVQLITLKNNHFVLINSMAMEGDYCNMCTEARYEIEKISEKIKCAESSEYCPNDSLKGNYSRPILMQHFPLYRLSDAVCNEPDSPPLPEKNVPFRLKVDALSKEATEYLVSKIRPRAVFGGHTHHGCLLHHSYKKPKKIQFVEYSVPSFSWRNRPDPKYMLVTISPKEYAVAKCVLPTETFIVASAVVMLLITVWCMSRIRTIGRLFT